MLIVTFAVESSMKGSLAIIPLSSEARVLLSFHTASNDRDTNSSSSAQDRAQCVFNLISGQQFPLANPQHLDPAHHFLERRRLPLHEQPVRRTTPTAGPGMHRYLPFGTIADFLRQHRKIDTEILTLRAANSTPNQVGV